MKDNIDSKQVWWMPAVVLFTRMSFWIAGPIVIALFVGKYFDKRFNSEPKIFILCATVAFLVSTISIVRISKKYIEKLERETKEKNVKQINK